MAEATQNKKKTDGAAGEATVKEGVKPPKPVKPGKGADTPAMRQHRRFKEQHPGCVLFFRMGDFYEMFFEDAVLAHKTLGVTLTQRSEGVPMAGVPYHAVEGYLRRMIQAGHRVAVCEQVEDAKDAKGVVKRDVTRVVTPGTLTDESLLEEGEENPLAAVVFHGEGGKGPKGQGAKGTSERQEKHITAQHSAPKPLGPSAPSPPTASIAWAELSTGAFHVATVPEDQLIDELARIAPRELIYCETATGEMPERVARLEQALGCAVTGRPGWQFRLNEAGEALRRQYQVAQLGGFGFDDDDKALMAAGGVVHYLLETQRADADGRLAHLRPPRRFERAKHLVIDQASLHALEVDRTLRSGQVEGSLLGIFKGKTGPVTAMGKRLLRHWLCYPLADREGIAQRQRVVTAMVGDERFRDELRSAADDVHDIERITARLAVGRATPRDLVALGRSVAQVRAVHTVLDGRPSEQAYLDRVSVLLEPLEQLGQSILDTCIEAPPAHLREGGLIRDGVDVKLDTQRSLQRDSHAWLAQYQAGLCEASGIPSLKVGYNKVFGYYLEVTAANKHKAQAYMDQIAADGGSNGGWARKQTLKNAERYVTPELKEFEGKVLSAEGRAVAREQHLFAELCAEAQALIDELHGFAAVVAELDVLGAFAARAVRSRYVCPTIVDGPVLDIEAGRHPVLDELLGDRFVPNDVSLGVNSEQSTVNREESKDYSRGTGHCSLALITGPNMAGKSTYIRQTALITLLAHTGSFVPADRAVVGLTDRIFTRVGANDELHAGQSTFMVEMTETANICHHATGRSLVILDEIGRGTSTLDGLSLAWAIAEHLAGAGADAGGRGPRTLFATHYHEITSLAERYDSVTNLSVTVREWQDEIVFLHRIAPGATDRSYGIHVAKIAGLPPAVIDRANQLLAELAVNHAGHVSPGSAQRSASDRASTGPANLAPLPPQLSLFTEHADHPALAELRGIDLNALTPLQAFDALRRLSDMLGPQDA
ncbi:DNA mismatch repair protein MutS [Phycisphaeraceae bacterium D3-23]